MKKYLCLVFILSVFMNTYSQQTDSVATTVVIKERPQSPYKIKPWIDIPVTVVTDLYSLYGMSVIYGRDPIPESEILSLDRNKVNSFDRPITYNNTAKSKQASDYLFYGSMPLPLFLLIDKKIRREGWKVGMMYLQAMGITGTVYTTSAMIANRYRPYAYNPNVPMETRQRGGARNSFFAGHPAVVGTATFFMAKVYADYHPNMKHKWILYTLAAGATATCGILRLQAGQHFRTDVITGVIVGPLVGVLVPHFHKNKAFGSPKLALYPNFQNGATGFTAFYKLGK